MISSLKKICLQEGFHSIGIYHRNVQNLSLSGRFSLKGVIFHLKKLRFLDFLKNNPLNLTCKSTLETESSTESLKLGTNPKDSSFLSRLPENWIQQPNTWNQMLWKCSHKVATTSSTNSSPPRPKWCAFLVAEKALSGKENLFPFRTPRRCWTLEKRAKEEQCQ